MNVGLLREIRLLADETFVMCRLNQVILHLICNEFHDLRSWCDLPSTSLMRPKVFLRTSMLNAQTADTSEVMQSETYNQVLVCRPDGKDLTAYRKTDDLLQLSKDLRIESTCVRKQVDMHPTRVSSHHASTDVISTIHFGSEAYIECTHKLL